MKGVEFKSESGDDAPIIKKDLEDGILAEANKDGSIYVDRSVNLNTSRATKIIDHEKVHLDQMERGDLSYDKDNVIWKGKKYSRANMEEGAKNLPWEAEAYKKA